MNKHIISLAKAATIVASAAVFLSYKNRRDLRESILSYKSNGVGRATRPSGW